MRAGTSSAALFRKYNEAQFPIDQIIKSCASKFGLMALLLIYIQRTTSSHSKFTICRHIHNEGKPNRPCS